MTRDQSHRETALLSTNDLCLGRQRHHHLHGRCRHDDRHLQLHTRLSQWLTALRLPVDSWLTALKLTYQFERVPWRQRLNYKALEGRQWLAGDLTCNNWPITGQKVRERTMCTWKYIQENTCVCAPQWELYVGDSFTPTQTLNTVH